VTAARPTPRRIALVALGLPAAIILVDTIAFMPGGVMQGSELLGKFFFLWLVAKTALLAWCAGRVLGFTVYGWVVFLWSQVLLDVHTFAASHGVFGYQLDALSNTLVSAQTGFLTAWTFLGTASFPWRVASLLGAMSAIILHARLLDENSRASDLTVVQWIAAGVVVLVCLALRLRRFAIRRVEPETSASTGAANAKPANFQFGVKHMLIWTAALAPLLIVVQTVDVRPLRELAFGDVYPVAVVVLCIALATLSAIWLGLGAGMLVIRLFVTGVILAVVSNLLMSLGARWRPPMNNWNWNTWRADQFYRMVAEMGDLWRPWLTTLAGLLAAMLLFLRACDYRLAKTAPRDARS
jgi:hypothetical protein